MSPREFLSEEKIRRVEYIYDALGEVINDLTKWEEEFLLSTQSQFKKDGKLSSAQIEILEKIYDKYGNQEED